MAEFSEVPLDEVVHWDEFTSAADGTTTDATGSPTFLIFEEANDTPIVSGTYTQRSGLTGHYRGTATLSAANGFEVGKWYSLTTRAIVSGIDGSKVSKSFRIIPAEAAAGYREVNVAKWNNLATVALPLTPTTAGRTLDVSATGEAGVDWANVGSPTTTLNLSGTTVKTATDVAAAVPSAAAVADAVWDELTAGHTVALSYGDKFGTHLKGVLKVIVGAGSTTTQVVLNATTGIDGAAPNSGDDFYNGASFIIQSGALAGQRTNVTDYVGSTKTMTVTALTAALASGVTGELT